MIQIRNVIFKSVVTSLAIASLLMTTGCSSVLKSTARQKKKPLAFEKWKSFTPADKSFTATFPVDPTLKNKPQKSTKSDSFSAKTGRETYTVSVSTTLNDEAAFRRDADAGALKRRADLLSKDQKAVTVAGEPGLECKWDQGSVHHRALLLKTHQGTHLYVVGASWKTSAEPANVEKFFASFKPGAYTPKPVPTTTPDVSPTPEPEEEEETPSGTATPDDEEGEE